MRYLLDRRELILGGASIMALTALPRAAFADSRVRLIWWGNPERDRRTQDVVTLYQERNQGVTVDLENYAWADYWQKLATQAAGGNLPDVIQMDYRYIFEYARRGQLAALDEFVGGPIDLSDFDQYQLDSGKVDGQLYGISMGANSMSHVYNTRLLSEAGITLPDTTAWTTDDFIALGNEVKGALPEGVYWTANFGIQENMLETWVRQRGKALYTEDGLLGFEEQDLADFWAYWLDLQEQGLTPPADVMAEFTGKMEETMLVTGRSVWDFVHSNQLVAIQSLVQDELEIVMIPNQADGQPGQYLKPSMLMSMSASSADPAAAAQLIDFFITDPDANDILLIERGVTGDASIKEQITPKLTETEQKIVAYLDVVGQHVGTLPPPPPLGAGEIDREIEPRFQAVAFGQKSVSEAAAEFYEFARTTLERA